MALKLSELGASLRKAIEPLVSALNPEFVLLLVRSLTASLTNTAMSIC